MSVQHFDGSVARLERLEDDIKQIRKRCKSSKDWQKQIMVSLINSGWVYSMLMWLPASDQRHWLAMLETTKRKHRRLFDPSFEQENIGTAAAHRKCGNDREQWFMLALADLEGRGWTRTMLSVAFDEPRTNVIRRLDKAPEALTTPGRISALSFTYEVADLGKTLLSDEETSGLDETGDFS